MREIRNDADLEKLLEELIGEALDDTAEEVLELFLTKYIDKFAYIKNPKEYSRTLEFRNSWEFSDLKRVAMSLSRELWFNPANMKTFNPKKFQHGSKYSSPNDIRDNLPAILEGKRSSLWISVERKVKFWEKFVEDMIDRGKLERIITRHLSKRGIRRV